MDSVVDDSVDHFSYRTDLDDQSLGLSRPPHATVQIATVEYFTATADTRGEVRNVVERGPRLGSEFANAFGDRVAGHS